jgi:peptide/nickel transport system substrate-binding protein
MKVGIAALVSFSLVAAACGGDDDSGADTDTPVETDAPQDTAGETDTTDAPVVSEGQIDEGVVDADGDPVAGGTLRYGLEADVDGINPTTSALSAPGLMMANAVFDTLAAWNADGEPVPYLAESIEPVDGDIATWQVKLREGITFHDGTPANADAILKSFETQRADPLVGLAVRPFYPEEGATEKIDDLTVQFNLLEPNAYFPGALTGQLGYLSSPAWLDAALADPTLNQQPVGTGPFVFDSRSPDSVTRFVRNDNWWNGEVYLDAVEFVPVPDPDTRVDLFFNGDLQALQTTNPATVDELQSDETVQNIIDETGEESFAMMNTAAPPFDDIRARQALTFATPKQDYLDLINLGLTRSADQRFIPESKYYNPDVTQMADMPDEAVALAAEYCAERGGEQNPVLGTTTCTGDKINIELQWSGPAVVQTQIAELLDRGWSVAFNVTFNELPQDDHILQTAIGQYNVNTWRQFGAEDPMTDNVWLMCRNIGGISLNWPRYCSEERDALLLAAQASTDEAERIDLYQQVEQNINDAYTYVFFNHTKWNNAFAENVRGVCGRTSPEGEPLRCVSNGRNWFDAIWFVG